MRVVYEGIEKYDGPRRPLARMSRRHMAAPQADLAALAGRTVLGVALLSVFIAAMIAAAII